jgi:imidazolonepropionase-like amidohydrolase
MRPLPLCRALLLAAVAVPSLAGAERVAYVNATFHPIDGEAIVGGAMLVEDGRIAALGAAAGVAIGDARVIDLGGLHVWPGMIDAATNLGLVEVGAVRATVDTTEIGDYNPDLRAEVAVHPDSRRLPVTAAGGVLTAHVVPDGELFLGRSAAIRVDGWTWEEMTLAAPLGQHLRYPAQRFRRGWWNSAPDAEEKFEKAKKEKVRRLDDLVGEARGYARARQAMAEGSGPAIAIDPRHEAMLPLLAGEATLFLWANETTQIEKALDWVQKEGFAKVVLVSGPDAAPFAERLAAAKIPVILEEVLMLPTRDWEAYDTPFTAAARLHAAGVALAFADGGDSSNARNLPFQAAQAVAFGLPRDAALRALTLGAAEILGVADRVGSLAAGKEATFFVSTGDLLDLRSRIERVVVRGAEYDLSRDPQRQLWERYRDRPAPAAPR